MSRCPGESFWTDLVQASGAQQLLVGDIHKVHRVDATPAILQSPGIHLAMLAV